MGVEVHIEDRRGLWLKAWVWPTPAVFLAISISTLEQKHQVY